MTSPLLWYLNRGSGVGLLVVLTLTTTLGVLATGRRFTPLWPRFITQGLHKALGGVSAALLIGHAVVAVIDEFVDIRWWQAFVPWGSAYEPFALGLGTAASDLLLIALGTSMVRLKMPESIWRAIHLTTYAAWFLGVLHGLLIGSDVGTGWLRQVTWACVAVFALGVIIRLLGMASGQREQR